MMVIIEEEVLADKLVDDEILIGEFWPFGGILIERIKDTGPNLGPNLGQRAIILQGLLQYLFQLPNTRHIQKYKL